jgi:hypothetical protein
MVTPSSSGTEGNRIVFGEYGTGDSPTFNGAAFVNNATFSEQSIDPVLYSVTPDTNRTTGGTRNYRNVFTPAASSDTIRITFQAADANDLVIAGASIGPQSSGSAATSLTRITFNTGSAGATITAGNTLQSDEITIDIVDGENYLVHLYMTSTYFKYDALSEPSPNTWYDSNGDDETLVTTPDGTQLTSTFSSIHYVIEAVGNEQTIWKTTTIPNYSISELTATGTTATATSPSFHSLKSGQWITVSGASDARYNITAQITVTDSTHFTYTIESGAASPASGTITYIIAGIIAFWEDDVFLIRQDSATACSPPGSWYWDSATGTLYVNGWDEDDPTANGKVYDIAHLSYNIWDNDQDYLEFEYFKACKTYGSADADGTKNSNAMSGIFFQGSYNLIHDYEVCYTLRHCFFFYTGSYLCETYNYDLHDDLQATPLGCYGAGTTLNYAHDGSVYHTQAACGGSSMVMFHGGASDNTVESTLFDATIGDTTDAIYTFDDGTDGNAVKLCHFKGITRHLIWGVAVDNFDFIYNLVEGSDFTGSLGYFQNGSGETIENNTFIVPSDQYGLDLVNTTGVKFRNNIIDGPLPLSVDTDSQTGFVSDYNDYYDIAGVSWIWGVTTYTSLDDWKTSSTRTPIL